jgi:hypothetical protein
MRRSNAVHLQAAPVVPHNAVALCCALGGVKAHVLLLRHRCAASLTLAK